MAGGRLHSVWDRQSLKRMEMAIKLNAAFFCHGLELEHVCTVQFNAKRLPTLPLERERPLSTGGQRLEGIDDAIKFPSLRRRLRLGLGEEQAFWLVTAY